MNKRQSELNEKTDPKLYAMNAFYFYRAEEQDRMRSIWPMITDQQMEQIISQSWFLLSESQRMKYELMRRACVTSYFQEQAKEYCNEIDVPFENLKYICEQQYEKFDQMYVQLQLSKPKYPINNHVINNKMLDQEQIQRSKDSVEVINMRMKSSSPYHEEKQNTKPLNFQINYCSSSREILQNANLMKDLICKAISHAAVEIYPIGGKSGDLIIYKIEEGQSTLIWSSLVDGFISQDDNQSFMKVLKQILKDEN